MSFLRQLTEKPWRAGGSKSASLPPGDAYTLPAPSVALRVILVIATVVFALFVVAYGDRMTFSDWRPLAEPSLLWANTIVLVLSSAAWHWATLSVRRGQAEGVRTGLLLGGGFAVAFLFGQYWAWQQLIGAGYFAESNPANAYFYLLTGVHAVHVLGGLLAWGWVLAKVWRASDVVTARLGVEMCAVYWHFLLVVWLVLFALLSFT